MSASNYEEIAQHYGHKIVIALYGHPPVNAAVECEPCGVVLIDFERGDDE